MPTPVFFLQLSTPASDAFGIHIQRPDYKDLAYKDQYTGVFEVFIFQQQQTTTPTDTLCPNDDVSVHLLACDFLLFLISSPGQSDSHLQLYPNYAPLQFCLPVYLHTQGKK